MTASGLIDLPVVQDAIQYVLQQLVNWQVVPQRIQTAQAEAARLGGQALQAGDPATVAQLAVLKQNLDRVSQEYVAAGPQVAEIVNAARVAQSGGSVATSTIIDAAKLSTTMAANLGALAASERDIQSLGGTLTIGPSGGTPALTWMKWGLIGLVGFWLLRKVR